MDGTDKKRLVPRRVDTIARSGQRTFLLSAGTALTAFFLWSSMVELDSVTRGSGSIVPFSQNQIVQHLEGGIVREILVREGDHVDVGDVLVRIEDKFSNSEYEQAVIERRALSVRRDRLSAEARGERDFMPETIENGTEDAVLAEQQLFVARAARLRETLGILDDQIRQSELELAELKARSANLAQEQQLIRERVESLTRLEKRGAVSRNELLQNRTALQQVTTKVADLRFQVPRTEAQLSEASRRRNEAILAFRTDAERERVDVDLAITKLDEKVGALADRKGRSDVTAPLAGTVNKLNVTTIGGVVRPGQNIAEIVPGDRKIAVEVKLRPRDRGNVWPGLPAIVKITAYEFSVYGGIKGTITEVSPDALKDEAGNPYFRVRLEADGTGLGEGNPVVPGMLADVDILTAKHTVLEYLMLPVLHLKERALRQ